MYELMQHHLVDVVFKVLSRLLRAVEEKLRDEQGGFRPGRGCLIGAVVLFERAGISRKLSRLRDLSDFLARLIVISVT